jgi:predicted DNA-binding transcriptional regulator YafY
MRKAERLFQLVTLLRGRKQVLTAEAIAESLNVSVRTIYRDIQSLSLSGVPIEGEAGVGYRLSSSFDIPPVMFTQSEMTAIMLALKMVRGHSDPILSKGAEQAQDKLLSVLPEKVLGPINELPYYVPDFSGYKEETKWHPVLRECCLEKRKILVSYTDRKDEQSYRKLLPLGLMFWGPSWTLLAWCELRADYRSFRLDRFNKIETLNETFEDETDKSVAHFYEIHGYCSS